MMTRPSTTSIFVRRAQKADDRKKLKLNLKNGQAPHRKPLHTVLAKANILDLSRSKGLCGLTLYLTSTFIVTGKMTLHNA